MAMSKRMGKGGAETYGELAAALGIEDPLARQRRLGQAWREGLMTVDEFRDGMGLPPIGGEQGASTNGSRVMGQGGDA